MSNSHINRIGICFYFVGGLLLKETKKQKQKKNEDMC